MLLPESLRREDRLRRFAQQLVRHHYNAISFVAGYLAEKLELTGAEIDVWIVECVDCSHGIGSPACTGNTRRYAKCYRSRTGDFTAHSVPSSKRSPRAGCERPLCRRDAIPCLLVEPRADRRSRPAGARSPQL